jgi:hypothetical protein
MVCSYLVPVPMQYYSRLMPHQEEQIIDDSQVHAFVRGEAEMKYYMIMVLE